MSVNDRVEQRKQTVTACLIDLIVVKHRASNRVAYRRFEVKQVQQRGGPGAGHGEAARQDRPGAARPVPEEGSPCLGQCYGVAVRLRAMGRLPGGVRQANAVKAKSSDFPSSGIRSAGVAHLLRGVHTASSSLSDAIH
jgi:hypothetical protein